MRAPYRESRADTDLEAEAARLRAEAARRAQVRTTAVAATAAPVVFVLPAIVLVVSKLGVDAEGGRWSVMATITVSGVLLLLAHRALVVMAQAPRGSIVASLALGSLAPLFAFAGGRFALLPVVPAPPGGIEKLVLGDYQLLPPRPDGFAGLSAEALTAATLALLVVGVVIGGRLAVARRLEPLAWTARAATAGCVLVAALTFAPADARDADTFLTALPASELEAWPSYRGAAPISVRVGARTLRYVDRAPSADVLANGDLPADGSPPADGDVERVGIFPVVCSLEGLAAPVRATKRMEWCVSLQVRVDEEADAGVVEWLLGTGPTFAPAAAFRPSSGELFSLTPRSVAAHLAAPAGWRAGGAFAAVVAVACVALGARLRRRARRDATRLYWATGLHADRAHERAASLEAVALAASLLGAAPLAAWLVMMRWGP